MWAVTVQQAEAYTTLTARFVIDFYALVGEWARWASEVVESWPDDLDDLPRDRSVTEDVVRRAERAARDTP